MKEFIYKFIIANEAIDLNGHVNNAYYLKFMQDAAQSHSDFVGDTFKSQLANGFTWVVRRNEIDYLAQLFLGDEIEIKTWVTQEKKASSKRYFEFIKAEKIVVKAITTYVYFDLQNKRPVAIPPEIAKLYEG